MPKKTFLGWMNAPCLFNAYQVCALPTGGAHCPAFQTGPLIIDVSLASDLFVHHNAAQRVARYPPPNKMNCSHIL